jgi:molybdate transport system substrate-binding protein
VRARKSALLLVVAVPAVLAACSSTTRQASSAAAQSQITVLAASSLKAALTAAATAYQSAHPDVAITLSFDASSALRTKIEQGHPADVFASADVSNAQKLVDDGFAIGPAQPFAGNRLAIVVPRDNPARIVSPADLARPGVRLIAAGESVPITVYADQLVTALGHQPGYPAEFAKKVAANVASREDNVAAVLSKVALGEGDAGIVYRTDALGSPSVQEIPLPAGVNVAVTYAAVVVKTSSQTDAARGFLEWLSGAQGQADLARFGFVAPP